MDLTEELTGVFNLEFVDGKRVFGVSVISVIFDGDGHPIILIGEREIKYNWSTIVTIQRVGS